MISFFKWLLKLLGFKKKEKKFVYNIENIIEKCILNNLMEITGKQTDITINKINFEDYKNRLKKINKGFICSYFDFEGITSLNLILNENFVNKYYQDYIKYKEIDNFSYTGFFDLFAGNIPALFYIFKNIEENSFEIKKHFSLPKTFDAFSFDEILWDTSGFIPYQILIEDESFFILINEDSYIRLNKDLAEFEEIKNFIKSSILNNQITNTLTEHEQDILLFKIKKPKEFIISSFFLPDILKAENIIIKSTIKKIVVQKKYLDLADKNGLWLIINLTYTQYNANIIYFFNCNDIKVFESTYCSYKEFVLAISNYVLSFHKEKMNNPNIKINLKVAAKIEKNIYDKIEYCFHSYLKINREKLDCRIYTSDNYINSLIQLFIPPWEITYIVKNLDNLIARILSLNTSFFSKNFNAVLENMFTKDVLLGSAEIQTFPFYQYMDLINNRDLRIIIQNYLIVKFQIQDVLSLFYLKEENIDENHIIELDFDKERFIKYLPKNTLDDFNYKKTHICAKTMSDFEKINKSVMYTLFDMVMQDKIIVSDKAKFILNKLFYEFSEAKAEEELNQIIMKKIPFIHLERMSKSQIINKLNSQKTQDLALSLIKHEKYIDFVNKHIAESKKEDLSFLIKKAVDDYKNKKIKIKEIKEAIMRMNKEFAPR